MIDRHAHHLQYVPSQEVKEKFSKKLTKKLTSQIIELSSRDEKTLLDPINHGVRDARMASMHDDHPQPKKRKHATKKGHEEIYCCPAHDCQKRFVNLVEFENHMTAWHADRDENPSPRPSLQTFPVRSKPVERRHLVDGLTNDDVEPPTRSLADITSERHASDQDDIQSDIARSVSQLSRMTMSDIMPASSTHSLYTDSMALESDAALSDIAETESQEVQRPVRILLSMWYRFVSHYVKTHTNSSGQGNEGQRSRGRQSSGRMSSSSLPERSASISSSTMSNKHPRDDEDEDGARKKPKPSVPFAQLNSVPLKDRPLACPFNKFDNIQFGEGNQAYHVCSTWNSTKTAYLKQHLQRSHCPPQYCCPRCQQDCKTAAALLEHQRQEIACTKQQLDTQKILPQHQDTLGLRNRNQVGQDRETYWFEVFELLFPGEKEKRDQSKKKIDPYYRGPAHEVLERFLRFSELNLSKVLTEVRRQLKFESESTPERDADLGRMILHEASQLFMDEMSNATPIDLRQLERKIPELPEIDDAEAEQTVKLPDPSRQQQSNSLLPPPPPPTISSSEADFTEMGHSTMLPPRQSTVDPSILYRQPHEQNVSTLHVTDPVRPTQAAPQTYQSDVQPMYVPPSFQDFEQLLADTNFDEAIEANDMYGHSDNEFQEFELLDKNF